MKDHLGDRMKMYEQRETSRRFMDRLPVYARMDGRAFSKFTKDMERPYDMSFSRTMVETVKDLVRHTGAVTGYTQSDEISLVFYAPDPKSQIFFNGKIQKMVSQLAALTTIYFFQNARIHLERKGHNITSPPPTFDARVFEMPNIQEAANAFLWREWDATKNSISMAASHYFSHKTLHKKTSKQRLDMLHEIGVNWNEYPAFFKRGTYVQRVMKPHKLTERQLEQIPEHVRPSDGMVLRSHPKEIQLPPLKSIKNRAEFICLGEEPKRYTDE